MVSDFDRALRSIVVYCRHPHEVDSVSRAPYVGLQGIFRGSESGMEFVYWDVTNSREDEPLGWRHWYLRLHCFGDDYDHSARVVFGPSKYVVDNRGNRYQSWPFRFVPGPSWRQYLMWGFCFPILTIALGWLAFRADTGWLKVAFDVLSFLSLLKVCYYWYFFGNSTRPWQRLLIRQVHDEMKWPQTRNYYSPEWSYGFGAIS